MANVRRFPKVFIPLAAVALLFLFTPVIRGWLGRIAVTATRPLVKMGQYFEDRLPALNGTKNITKERDLLRQQVEDVTNKLYQTNIQLETVQAAIKLSDFSSSAKLSLRIARVISTSPDPGIQSIVIDQGSNTGVAIGQVVVAERGSVIGKVVAVHQNQSSVLLLSDRQSVMAVRIQNQQQSPGVIRGERGLTLKMSFIPKIDSVNVGDTVVTSGNENNIPPDILIGSVSITSSHSGDLFQESIVTPAAPLNRLRVVGVVLP